jgi:hypothetical protein
MTFKEKNKRQATVMDQDAENRIKAVVTDLVLGIFPDICPQYLTNIAEERGYDLEALVSFIADQCEQRKPYPKAKQSSKKRKRESFDEDEAENAVKQFDNPQRRSLRKSTPYIEQSRELLRQKVSQNPINQARHSKRRY